MENEVNSEDVVDAKFNKKIIARAKKALVVTGLVVVACVVVIVALAVTGNIDNHEKTEEIQQEEPAAELPAM